MTLLRLLRRLFRSNLEVMLVAALRCALEARLLPLLVVIGVRPPCP